MKKLFYFLFTLAAALGVASCQLDKIGGPANPDDGTLVDATFSMVLGTNTKAFADGTTVDKLYAGIYELGADGSFTWVADNSSAPVTISSKTATVTFSGKLQRGKSYRVVSWAQKSGAPYTIDWAVSGTAGPVVTATATGDANDEGRDAFFGIYDTGEVTSNIDLTNSPITLKRPFAQINVLVPNGSISDASAAVSSSMTVAQAPTKLNLATKATSSPADWTFNTAAITESAFGNYSNTHKYVAMNYVLVNQTGSDARYDITFSVTAGTQSAADRQVNNTPLKANGRTNLVGDIFGDNFDIIAPVIIDPVIIDPDPDTEEVATTVTVAVGQTAEDAFELTPNTTSSVEVVLNHTIETEAEKPEITVEPAGVVSAEWNLSTGKLDITPLAESGSACITLVFPSVTRAVYSAATATIYVKVGNTAPPVPEPDFTTVAGLKALLGAESATFTGTLTDAVVSFIAGTVDAIIKDATGSILYHKESGHGLLQGQTISGDVIVDAVIYNGINEITDLAATVEGEESAVEPQVVTFAQLKNNFATYESAYVKVVGVTSNTTTTKKGNIQATQNGADYVVYTNVAVPVNTGDVFTAEGTVTKYNTTEEVKVWKAADLTVTTAAPVLSASPAATTVAATATSVTWTIISNTNWTITPGTGVTASVTSGNGNADITLAFAANTGSTAATYTATVSAAGCDDVTITITQQGAGGSSGVKDTITSALLTATSTTYTDFSNVAATSQARYAGNSAKSSSGGIQLRSKNSNSGIVSTVSGGKVKSVTITVESGSNVIDVYGSNTAYTGAGDLYATGEGANQGTKIGSLSETGTITFTGNYSYVGIRSNNGAVYVTSVEIVWE